MKMEKEEFQAVVEKKKKTRNNTKRFSDEQIRSLESMFEEETKLEPRRKLQLAKDLGLQPRQVAIWFQNRRARWKSKQLEREYAVLKNNYDALAASFESLKKEKHCLLKQLQKLSNMLGKPQGERWCSSGPVRNSGNDVDSDNGEAKCSECEEKPALSLDEGSDVRVVSGSNGGNCQYMEVESFGTDEEALLNMAETADRTLALPEVEWCGLDSACFSDQSSSSFPWWDLWP